MKKSPIRLIAACAAVVFGGLLVASGVRGIGSNKDILTTPGGSLRIEVVSTPEVRQRGLSGRESLDTGSGMLFVFDTVSERHCLWMKDMKFSIDMVWLDEQKRVVTIAESVSPETYPQTFCPNSPARYALELSAGQAAKFSIKTGEKLTY